MMRPTPKINDTASAAAALWQEPMSQASEADVAGIPLPRLAQHVVDCRRDVAKRMLGPLGREVLDALMPRLLTHIGDGDTADVTFERLAPVLLSIVSRTTYLELLLEYPSPLWYLIRLCAACRR